MRWPGFVLFICSVTALTAQTVPAFQWVRQVPLSADAALIGLGTDATGNAWLVGNRAGSSSFHHTIFASRLDTAGNVVFTKYIGGTGDNLATAMAVDAAGNVYVAGSTTATDFPTTPGSYSPGLPPPPPPGPLFGGSGTSFVFRLNADGAVGYSTYFTLVQTYINAIAVDSTGSAYITGYTYGGVPVTLGAYQTVCNCIPQQTLFLLLPTSDSFVARFNPAGSQLLYSTYLGVKYSNGQALAVAPDATAYIGSDDAV
jgi:hypothetical protein